jgi:hypothetical protein
MNPNFRKLLQASRQVPFWVWVIAGVLLILPCLLAVLGYWLTQRMFQIPPDTSLHQGPPAIERRK